MSERYDRRNRSSRNDPYVMTRSVRCLSQTVNLYRRCNHRLMIRSSTGSIGVGWKLHIVARVALLFQNWMTDTNEASQDRALRGHRNARKIYIEVMTGIDARDPEGKEDGK